MFEPSWGETNLLRSYLFEYWEAMPTKSAYFNESLRFVVATFPSLFGDDDRGARLRRWCVERGKLLVWGRGSQDYVTTNDLVMQRRLDLLPDAPPQPYNGRWLDPFVLGEVPSTLPRPTPDQLDKYWALWHRARKSRPFDDDGVWLELYASLSPEYRVVPLTAGACDGVDDCVGTTLAAKTCVCYL